MITLSAIPQRFCLALIGVYQRWISPLMAPRCRFAPSCSEYAKQALECHGVFGGLWRAVWRLLRCHPFHPGGYDPVPSNLPPKHH
jgi:putative membrane protein insertion efficiency factor